MKSEIDGVVITELKRWDDPRGWLIELFRQDELEKGLFPVMLYVSLTKPGMIRGPHEHSRQTDYFCFIGPSTFRLYVWDNRSDSISFRKKCQIDVGEGNQVAVIIPPGVVHGYKNIGEADGIVYNAANRLYRGENRKEPADEIRHEDISDSPFVIDK